MVARRDRYSRVLPEFSFNETTERLARITPQEEQEGASHYRAHKKTSRRSGRRVVPTDGKPTGTGVRHTPILFGSRDPQERLQSMLVDT